MGLTSTALAAAYDRAKATCPTIEEARAARLAIETELATWEPTHPYANSHIKMLTAMPGTSGPVWLAHFWPEPGLDLQDVPFEIDGNGRARMAFQALFFYYQLQPDLATPAPAEQKVEAGV
jgi:hypothetical protein